MYFAGKWNYIFKYPNNKNDEVKMFLPITKGV